MMNFTTELMEKARGAKSAEELLALARENGVEDFTEESAGAYFALLYPATGEVTDDELENVTGGGCYSKGELIVTAITDHCSLYRCEHCGKTHQELHKDDLLSEDDSKHRCTGKNWMRLNACGSCEYCKYKRGLWLCTHPQKHK